MLEADIFSDLWVLRHKISNNTRNRIDALRQINAPPKPWLFRTTTLGFER